ncbi:MAG: asparagine synthase (glutamine-hydrolyzing) [Candidatus Poseidoniaceae archaeon]
MCGLAGMLGAPEPSTVKKMIQLQNHRGPDGSGFWHDESVCLGHARLAIVDLEGSPQPIQSQKGNVLIANGEIYNFESLRSSMSDYPWTTFGDSETILAMFEKTIQGNPSASAKDHSEWIHQLDGMFAFALWNPERSQLILARDEMGIKPLVRTRIGSSLVFSSEVKALRAHPDFYPQLDEHALMARLVWEYPLDATTLFLDVHQVRPGTVEVWSFDQSQPVLVDSHRFSTPNMNPVDDYNEEMGAQRLLDGFIDSVGQRLMADVPVGIVLSGGLDSSLVAAVANDAAHRYNRPTPECWTVAESEDNPDWMAAEHVASSLDLKHHQSIMEEDSFSRHLPSLSWHGEDLDVSVLFFQPLFKTMSKSVRVGLCGQGADEIHAGYPRYTDLNGHKRELEHRMTMLNHPFARQFEQGELDAEDDRWWVHDHRPETHLNSLQDTLQFELEHGQLSNFQLRLVDRHSMAHSLEVRVPFLGRSHRKDAFDLPMHQRLPQTGLEKKALRKAASLTSLPNSVVERKKLPAGTATSPTLLSTCLQEYSAQIEAISSRWSFCEPLLRHQPEIALGLGLFESLHLIEYDQPQHHRSIDDLLAEVI